MSLAAHRLPLTPLAPDRAPLTGRMVRVCMYCKQSYGFVPCTAGQDGHETHGVCHARECRAEFARAWVEPLHVGLPATL